MDQLKKRIDKMRADLDAAVERAELAEAKNKKLEQQLYEATQANEINTNKINGLESEVETSREKAKTAEEARKLLDVRADNAERQNQQLLQQVEKYEGKYEAEKTAHAASKKELDELVRSLDSLN